MKMKGSREDTKDIFYFSDKALQNALSTCKAHIFSKDHTHSLWHCLIYLTNEFKP